MNDNERMKLRRSRPQRLEDRRGQTRRLDLSLPRRKTPNKKANASYVDLYEDYMGRSLGAN